MSKVTTTLYGDLALLPLEALEVSKEIIEWTTGIFISNDGSEEREKLRINARKKIFYKFFENYVNKIPGFITEYGAYTELWALPLWAERQYLGVISSGGVTLPAITDIFDFRDASLALLYESPSSWQIIEIETVETSQLNLLTAIEGFNRAWLMPVRVGTTMNKISRLSNGRNAYSDIGFDIVDVLDPTESVPDQYLGNDSYTEELFTESGRYRSSISNDMDKDDFVLGKVNKVYRYNDNRIIKRAYYLFDNQTDIFNFRSFLTRHAGRYRSYWEPTFEFDLINKSTGLVTTELLIQSDGFLDWDRQREHIGILDISGVWHFRTITLAVQTSLTVVTLTLDSSLNMQSSDIDTISFTGLKRFDTDVITLKWTSGGSVMDSEIETVEVSS